MKQKFKKILIVLVILAIGITVGYILFNEPEETSFNDKLKQIKEKNLLSYYLENENGEYVASTGESWPTDGYKFNSSLSKCENGGELGWDDINKVVTMTGNMSDKCYVYFDKVLTLADYVKAQYTGAQGENSIYYHKDLTNSAEDGSYRYAGASASVNNYVCFGSDEEACPTDNLYRIIGVFGDQVKLIKSTAASSTLLGTDGAYDSNDSYYWSTLSSCPSSSTTGYISDNSNGITFLSNKKNILAIPMEFIGCNKWEYSELNKTNLNANFITYLKNLDPINNKWEKMLATTTWKVGGNTYANIAEVVPKTAYQNEIANAVTTDTTDSAKTYSAQIGLMYVTDYEFAASSSAWILYGYNSDSAKDYRAAISINWMYLGMSEWTIFQNTDSEYDAFYVVLNGFVNYTNTNDTGAIRPVFYLTSTATYSSGKGEESDPIRIN